MSKRFVVLFIASLTVSSCVSFEPRNVNPEIDQNPKSISEKSEKSATSKVAPVRKNLEVIVFCDEKDKTKPDSALVRGKEVAWFLRKKTNSPRDLAMTDQDGMIYIPHIAEPTDEVIITYGKFVSKALMVENKNPIEVHIHCY